MCRCNKEHKTNKQDLTEYSDSELSLMVMNDEGLYRMRRNRANLLETLDEIFIYTKDQKDDLIDTLDNDEAENQ